MCTSYRLKTTVESNNNQTEWRTRDSWKTPISLRCCAFATVDLVNWATRFAISSSSCKCWWRLCSCQNIFLSCSKVHVQHISSKSTKNRDIFFASKSKVTLKTPCFGIKLHLLLQVHCCCCPVNKSSISIVSPLRQALDHYRCHCLEFIHTSEIPKHTTLFQASIDSAVKRLSFLEPISLN